MSSVYNTILVNKIRNNHAIRYFT